MSSKATKKFVLVPANVYFAEARCELVGLHSSSLLDPSEPRKRLNSLNEKLDRKFWKEKKCRITVGNYQQNNSIEHSRPNHTAKVKWKERKERQLGQRNQQNTVGHHTVE